jgi:hypothetical protein
MLDVSSSLLCVPAAVGMLALVWNVIVGLPALVAG